MERAFLHVCQQSANGSREKNAVIYPKCPLHLLDACDCGIAIIQWATRSLCRNRSCCRTAGNRKLTQWPTARDWSAFTRDARLTGEVPSRAPSIHSWDRSTPPSLWRTAARHTWLIICRYSKVRLACVRTWMRSDVMDGHRHDENKLICTVVVVQLTFSYPIVFVRLNPPHTTDSTGIIKPSLLAHIPPTTTPCLHAGQLRQ